MLAGTDIKIVWALNHMSTSVMNQGADSCLELQFSISSEHNPEQEKIIY